MWAELEPNKGDWRFSILDSYVAEAEKRGVEPLLVLGLAPWWAAGPNSSPSFLPQAPCSPPQNVSDWQNYVRIVATRYKGRIRQYELWNEAHVKQFYCGTEQQMLELARAAYTILKEVDPNNIVISPTGAWWWLDDFFPIGGGAYCDVIGYHFYVSGSPPDDPARPPESMLELVQKLRALMSKYNLADRPIWNTEQGWWNKVFSPDEAASYVARSYLLMWAAGIDRQYWYAWDNHTAVSLRLTQQDSITITPAGRAFAEVQKWMLGADLNSCAANSDGTWICALTRTGGYRAWAIWNPKFATEFSPPADWNVTHVRNLDGTNSALAPGSSVAIDGSPRLIENEAP